MQALKCNHSGNSLFLLEVSSHAKWILSGEHAVIRGGKAIAFPLKQYKCVVSAEKSESCKIYHYIPGAVNNRKLNEIFLALLNNAAVFSGVDLQQFKYELSITNNIPMNSGLGSSAAICVNIAKIFNEFIHPVDVFDLARHLENYFHKKSSGLDIATVMFNEGIVFQNNQVSHIVKPLFWPCMILTYSGAQSQTYACIEIVRKMFSEHEKTALVLDETMNEASNLCEYGLQNANFNKLKEGINLGCSVFSDWGLVSESLYNHMNMLRNKGAIAVKPIGSGLGGYVVSLWDDYPKLDKDIYLTLERP